MKIFFSDTVVTGYDPTAPPIAPKMFAEWCPKGMFYRKGKTVLDLERGLGKLDVLVRKHDLHGRPVIFDVEGEPISDLLEIAAQVKSAWPRLTFGFYCKTTPTPKPDDPTWAALCPFVSLTVSQGWANRRNLNDWTDSIILQARRWRTHFSGQVRAIAMAPRAHPNAMRRGWYPGDGTIPAEEFHMMLAAAATHYDVAIMMTQRAFWSVDTPWLQALAEIDTSLENIVTPF